MRRIPLVLVLSLSRVVVVQGFAPSLGEWKATTSTTTQGSRTRPSTPIHAEASLLSWSDAYSAWLERKYDDSIKIKCPFMRRRAADIIDGMSEVGQFLLKRHKTLGLFESQTPGCRAISNQPQVKSTNLATSEIVSKIEDDWKPTTSKGYYITGRLSTELYRNDCLFSGPDPDMPVKGLRKYLNAAAHLFDYHQSHADLLNLEVLQDDSNSNSTTPTTRMIRAHWQLEGVLRLPWRPRIPPWSGTTTYHLDHEGLIYHHEEQWDKTVWEAFCATFLQPPSKQISR